MRSTGSSSLHACLIPCLSCIFLLIGAYFHQFFVRDNRYLCQLITRTVSSGNSGPRSKRARGESKDGNKGEQNVQQRHEDSSDRAPSTNPVASVGKSKAENDDKDSTQQGPSTPPRALNTAGAGTPAEAPAPHGAILVPANLGVSPRLKGAPDNSTVLESGLSLPIPPWAVDGANAAETGSTTKLQRHQGAALAGGGTSFQMTKNITQSSSSGKDRGKSGEAGMASYASDIISLFTVGKPTATGAGAVSTGGQADSPPATSAATANAAANDSSPSDQQSNTSWDDIF